MVRQPIANSLCIMNMKHIQILQTSYILKCHKFTIFSNVVLCLLFIFLYNVSLTSQIVLNQIDDFNDGTLQNWSKGNNSPPTYLTNQNGSLQNIADGSGTGGKITMAGGMQWRGDYVSQGVIAIKMRIDNINSASPVHLRLVFNGTGGLSFVTSYVSKNPVIVASGTSADIVFPIEDTDLDKLQSFSSVSYTDLFSDVLSIRLIHSVAGGSSNGDEIVATLLIDDITATDGTCPNTGNTTPYDEMIDGDLSDDGLTPTEITFSDGSNRISACQNGSPRDIDYISFSVPSGKILERIDVINFTSVPSSNLGFIGIQNGTTFTEPANGANVANLLGGSIYGTNEIATDILPEMGMLGGAIGFTPPLTLGDYTIWLNQTSTESCVTLDFVLGDECPVNRAFVNFEIETGLFKAVNLISASGNTEISANDDVTFEAGQMIMLDPDFQVPLGASFSADIEPCVNTF